MKTFLYIISTFLLAALCGCNKEMVPSQNQNSINLPPDGQKVVTALNSFGFDFYKEALQQDQSNENKFISPFSIFMDLCMVYNGAATTTRQGMNTALHLNDLPAELLNKTSQSLIPGLKNADSKAQINIANSIWYRNMGVQPLKTFLNMASDDFYSKVNGADFDNASTVNTINNWVAKATNDKIKTIIDRISPYDIMYLINAVYFKGKWKDEFNKNQTINREFNPVDESSVQVPFMQRSGTFSYYSDTTVQAIQLPYGKGAYSMYVLLPSEKTNLKDYVASLDEKTFRHILSSMDSAALQLYLPKWEYRYEIENMRPELAAMGMGEAFTNSADFSGMYPVARGIYISQALHKTYIAVDEEGTEAAAATSVGMVVTSVQIPSNVMDANRPFLYVIAEKSTGAILFIGETNDPSVN